MKFQRLIYSAGLTAWLASVSPPAHAIVYWTIVDVEKTMNHTLKTMKKLFVYAEKELAYQEENLTNQLLTYQRVENASANKSSDIIAQTTATSQTQNARSEIRYGPTVSNAVCSMIQTASDAVNSISGLADSAVCAIGQEKEQSELDKLQARFLNPKEQDGQYIRFIYESNGFDLNTSAKDVIKAIYKSVDEYTSQISEYELIDSSSAGNIAAINELIFDWETSLPKPSQVSREITAHNVHSKTKDVFFSNTYEGYVKRNFNDRTIVNETYPPDTQLIESKSDAVMKQLSEDIAKAEYSDDALRLYALTFSKSLRTQYKKLENNLRFQTEQALKAKEILR
ncbi:hypothetical protein [Vibrio sp. Hal054]|uniref:hypothetical protein n=1 Tax=Vibrio sp. Hal054 TaxID=3035158 RepID=UPI00301E20BD